MLHTQHTGSLGISSPCAERHAWEQWPRAPGLWWGVGTMLHIFGEYTLDTQLYELRRAGERIHLGPQVFNVLAYLVQHRHRVVPKQELFERLWPGQFVGDDALERCIRVVRRALGDTRHAPQLIQTIRGRGYRFMALVGCGRLRPRARRGLAHPSQLKDRPR